MLVYQRVTIQQQYDYPIGRRIVCNWGVIFHFLAAREDGHQAWVPNE